MLGWLRPGDQLPSVKEVVNALSVNPNTVVKAFSELEHQGMVVRRQGVGTFVAAAPPMASLGVAPRLLGPLARWVDRARQEGLARRTTAYSLTAQVLSPRRTVDDTAASPGRAGRSSVVMPMASFMAAS